MFRASPTLPIGQREVRFVFYDVGHLQPSREVVHLACMAVLTSPTATLTLLELPGSKYRLRKAVIAEIDRDPAGFVVAEPSTGVFHYDPDLSQAISGFLRAFVDQFEFLKCNEDRLAPALVAELERFRSLLEDPSTE